MADAVVLVVGAGLAGLACAQTPHRVSLTGSPAADDRALDGQVRTQLRGWWGRQVDGWDPLATYRIPYAQPRMEPAELASLRRPVRVHSGLYVCGDHRDTASLRGALVSGRRTAEAILAA